MGIVITRDCTGSNLASAGWSGQMAGYVTGSAGIAWSAQQFAAHPGAVHIDQTPAGSQWDDTADVDDFERGAVLLGELADRAKARKAAFASNKRPGQREPMVYASASNISDVANALVSGGVKSGVSLWVANWGVTEGYAAEQVRKAAGPFPINAWQFANAGLFDWSVFSRAWLANVSAGPAHKHLTDGSESLTQLAASRGMSVQGWLSLQERLAGQAAADALGAAVPKAGTPWYSVG